MKKIIAMLIAIFFAVKVFFFDIYAFSAAPIVGEALTELFGSFLVGSGMYTTDEVSEMSWNECKTSIESCLSSGVNPLEVTGYVTYISGDGSQTTVQANYMEYIDYLTNPDTEVLASDLLLYSSPSELLKSAFGTANGGLTVSINAESVKADWVNNLTQENVIRTPVTDMNGYGCKVIHTNSDGSYYVYYSEYAEIYDNGRVNLFNDTVRELYSNKGVLVGTPVTSTNGMAFTDYDNCTYYGDVRYEDGTQAETDDTYTDEVGETEDGEKVTLENIQSGAVSADDVALDYDKFNDEAIIDLLSQILATLDSIPLVQENDTTYDDAKENIQAAVGELDIADFNNLKMPIGILDVFPFCLPVDFVRGMKTLVAEPKTPHFEANIVVPSFLGVPEQHWNFVIDLEPFEPLAKITRWCSTLAFAYVLIFISTKIVKGAGA